MIVDIIGWYGTETLGDCSILDGILRVLQEIDENSIINIGSLYPFYTMRTLFEERSVFERSAPKFKFRIFDVKDKNERSDYIKKAELLIFGGGPLMDLKELEIINSCFSIAYNKKIPIVIWGCGVGPLYDHHYIDIVKKLFDMSDYISFRDNISGDIVNKLYNESISYDCIGDPAVISVYDYKRDYLIKKDTDDKLVINFREYSKEEYGANIYYSDNFFCEIIEKLSGIYKKVVLMPMHTFSIGGDDRLYLSKLSQKTGKTNVIVQHMPLNLYELYDLYANSKACIGMRYHSIVMQTILNGNNYIIDYTDPSIGKIAGFLEFIKGDFYENRILHIQKKGPSNSYIIEDIIDVLRKEEKYTFVCEDMKKIYMNKILAILR